MSKVVFVGAGPGDPELITVKGKKALEGADIVIYAGSLVPAEMLSWAGPEVELIDSAPLTHERVCEIYERAIGEDLSIVRLHSGDPGLYGAIQEQIERLRELGIAFEVVPGVTAAFAAAAAAGREMTLPEVNQTVILTRAAGRTTVPPGQELERLAAARATICVYLSVHMAGKVESALLPHYGPDAPVVVGHHVSRPNEKMYYIRLSDLARTVSEAGIDSTAVILVSPVPGPLKQSKLYDKEFSHGRRTGA